MEKSKRMSLFTENGDLTDNKMIHGMFLGRLGISCDDMDRVLNGEKVLGELAESSTNVKEVEVIKEVPVEKVVEVVKEVPVPVEVEKVIEKLVNKPITNDDIIEYITRGDSDVTSIVDALKQCNYLSINDESKPLEDFSLNELAVHILQNASRTFLVQFHGKIGDLLKNSQARVIDPYDILSKEKINKIIDDNSDPELVTKYFVRLLQKDLTVPVIDMSRKLTYLPSADIRNARTNVDLEYFYNIFCGQLDAARSKRNSTIFSLIDFTFTVKGQTCNELATKHKIVHFDRSSQPGERFAYMLKDRIDAATCTINSCYKIKKKFTSNTFLEDLSSKLGSSFVISVLKGLGFAHADEELLKNRFFILNYSNVNAYKALLSTNNVLFTECADLLVNGYTLYDYYLSFIKALFDRVDDLNLPSAILTLVRYKIICMVARGSNSGVARICDESFKKNAEKFGSAKVTPSTAYMKVFPWKPLDNITNPMVAYNKYISSTELSSIFKCTIGDIMSACKNIDHRLNDPSNWERGTVPKIIRACIDHSVDARRISRMYKDPHAIELLNLRQTFPKEMRKKHGV